MARLLGAGRLGTLVLGVVVVSLGAAISRLGLEQGVVRYVSIYVGANDRQRAKGTIIQAMKYSFVGGVCAGFALLMTSDIIATRVFDNHELGRVIRVLALFLPFMSSTLVALSCTKGFKTAKYMVAGHNLFLPLSNLILAGALLLMWRSIEAAAVAQGIAYVLTFALSILFVRLVFPDIGSVSSKTEAKKLLTFSAPLLLVSIFTFVILWTDTLMLACFTVSEKVGIYNGAMKSALLIGIVLTSFNAIFAPVISELQHKGDVERMGNVFKIVAKWTVAVSVPFFLVMVLLSKEIMLLFGSAFDVGRPCLVILASAQLVNACAGSVGCILMMSGRQNLMMCNGFAIAALNALLNYLLIPPYGMVGAAFATGASIAVANIVMLVEVYWLLRIHPYSRKFLKLVAPSLGFAGVIIFVHFGPAQSAGLVGKLVLIPLSLVTIAGLMYRFGIDEEERSILSSVSLRLSSYCNSLRERIE